MGIRRTAVAATLAATAGLVIAHLATDGFAAYTLESARRLQALRAPAPIPALTLDLADGRRIPLTDLSGRILLVDFIYTRCATYCSALGSVYAQLKQRLAAEIAAGDVQLVSVSFDPLHDSATDLRAYRARHSNDPAGWDVGRLLPGTDLQQGLAAFGVVVIPDGTGGYAHNAAIHVVGPDRRLVAIHDLQDVAGVTATVRRITGESARVETTR